MPRVIFFDDDADLAWPGTLEFAWRHSQFQEEFGDCTTKLETDPDHLEAVLRQRKDPVDVLFMDLHWGRSAQDGIGLIERARRLSPALPIVVLTRENFSGPLVNACTQAGASAFWNKSDGEPLELLQTVAEALRRLAPLLNKADELRRIRRPDERARQALPWLEAHRSSLPVVALRESLGWLQEALNTGGDIKQRDCSLIGSLEGIVALLEELSRRAQVTVDDQELLACMFYHLGRWEDAESAFQTIVNQTDRPELWERLSQLAKARRDEEKSQHYQIARARALQSSGHFEKASEVCGLLAESRPGEQEILRIWIAAERRAGRSGERPLRVWLRQFAKLRLDNGEWITEINRLREEGISPSELALVLAEITREIPWAGRAHIAWVETLYLEEDLGAALIAANTLCPEHLDDPDALLAVADLFYSLDRRESCRDALLSAFIKASGKGREADILLICKDTSLRIGDERRVSFYLKHLLRLWTEYERFEMVQKEAESWIQEHPADLDMKELAADLR